MLSPEAVPKFRVAQPPPLDEKGNPAGGPANRRAEMWSNLKKALEAGRFCLPDRDSLQADLVSCGYKFTSEGKLLLESKQDMRKRGVPSPDEADAVALTFSEPDGSAFVRDKDFHRSLIEKYAGAMSEVREVIVTIKPSKGSFPGQVTYGWYALQDGVITLTDREGNPAGEETGRKFTYKLAPGEDAHAIACKLTKELRTTRQFCARRQFRRPDQLS
jgi:hypothetical protein